MKQIYLIFLFISISLNAGDIQKKIEACNSGDAGSCDIVGFSYQMKKEYGTAAEYYFKGCQMDFASSCYGLGRMYMFSGQINIAKNFFLKLVKIIMKMLA